MSAQEWWRTKPHVDNSWRTEPGPVAAPDIEIGSYWRTMPQVVEAGTNILPSHPLAAVQPDEIAEIHIAVMDRLVSAHIRELIKPLEGT